MYQLHDYGSKWLEWNEKYPLNSNVVAITSCSTTLSICVSAGKAINTPIVLDLCTMTCHILKPNIEH